MTFNNFLHKLIRQKFEFEKLTAVLFLVFAPYLSISQSVLTLQIDSLRHYSEKIASIGFDSEKYDATEKMSRLLEKIFSSSDYYSFPYDSIKKMSVQTSPDNKFKLLTWGIAKENGTYEYFGYIVHNPKTEYSKHFIKLHDNTDRITNPDLDVVDNTMWYGAIYYKIIVQHHQGKKIYTLLGWKGNNLLTTKKVIEILTFRSNGTPVFGKPIFKKNKEKFSRIIFEYSSRAVMTLRYDNQMIHTVVKPAKVKPVKYTTKDKKTNKAQKKEKKTKPKIKTIKADMIVFDRLAPIDPRTSKVTANLEGQYQFYAPETNIFDGFIFENGKWVFVKDIDARNPKPKKTKKFRKPQL